MAGAYHGAYRCQHPAKRSYLFLTVRSTVRTVSLDREAETRYWRAFGEWVRQQRAAQKPDRWTQDRLATHLAQSGLRVSRNWIVQIEKGDKPGPDLRRAIERLFGPFPEPGATPAPADNASVVAAIDRQTEALTTVIKSLARQPITAPAAFVDEATRKRRRAYWIQRAMDGMTVDEAMDRAEQPSSQAKQFRAWIAGELPRGANLSRFAAAVNLPAHVLTDPPETDDERLVLFRREAIGEVEQLTEQQPQREARRRTA
jgi:hypothetical protein